MPIMISSELADMDPETWQRIGPAIEKKLQDAPGFVLHVGCQSAGGWKIIEVWESYDAFSDWMEGPATSFMPPGYEPIFQVHDVHVVLK